MKIGTDGLLLGSWAGLEDAESILDIGTGTGLLALMAAQRNASARVFAVEIDADAAAQAQQNFRASPWGDRLQLRQGAIQRLEFPQKFDHIICNPPYFSEGIRSAQKARRTARHSDSLSLRELMMSLDRLLAGQGKATLVIPFDQQKTLLQEAAFFQLFPQNMLLVLPKKDFPPKRLLVEFSRERGAISEEKIIIQGENGYSDAYQVLTSGFYLKH